MASTWDVRPASVSADALRSWDAVNARGAQLPFFESAFLLPLLQHFGRGDEQVATCRVDGEPVAAALLQPSGFGRYTTFQPSQLPLGAWVAVEGQDSATLAAALLPRLPGTPLALGLTQLDPRFHPRPAEGPALRTLDYIQTAWVDVQGSFDAYWEARGKNLRTNMRKQRSKLEADGVSVQFEVLSRPEDVPQAIADYGRLETAGWKAGEGTAVHPDNAQGRFYTEMLQNFCAAGRGQVWRLTFGDKVVAMDLCIESGGTIVVLKTAYDPEYRTVSPAFLLKQDAFRRVFDEGRIRRIEFYGKLMEWHTRWTDNARMLYHANVYRWGWVPRARDLVRRVAAREEQPPRHGDGGLTTGSKV
jgi:CelD/BcsL family acetyltransferase involved in cellulose biosynthesis